MRFVVEMDHNKAGSTLAQEQGRGFVAFGDRRKNAQALMATLLKAVVRV